MSTSQIRNRSDKVERVLYKQVHFDHVLELSTLCEIVNKTDIGRQTYMNIMIRLRGNSKITMRVR